MSDFATKYRTHTCGELRREHVPKPGKPAPVTLSGFVDRKLGEAEFLIRDRHGKTHVTIAADALPYVPERVAKLNPEDVVQVTGSVAVRAEADPALATGEVQVAATALEVLSVAEPIPAGVMDGAPDAYDRLAMRQLYLRRPEMQERLEFRARVAQEIREFLLSKGFLEVEAPQLFIYDPVAIGGEIVPAGPGRAFSLAGGPIVLNQYIRPGGFDRFFHFAKITTREDEPTPLHQPEYTGLDINMAYADLDDIFGLVEEMLARASKVAGSKAELAAPFRRITWDDAVAKYGSDKVDLRAEAGGKDAHAPVWVHGWPMFENDEGNLVPTGVVFSAPRQDEDFIIIANADTSQKAKLRSRGFDLVLDGVELATGYLGIQNIRLQREIWERFYQLQHGDLARMRAPIEAHRFGCPPYAEVNLGFDRLVACLLGLEAIDEVMAFPKTQRCEDPMLAAPARVPADLVADLVAESGEKVVEEEIPA